MIRIYRDRGPVRFKLMCSRNRTPFRRVGPWMKLCTLKPCEIVTSDGRLALAASGTIWLAEVKP